MDADKICRELLDAARMSLRGQVVAHSEPSLAFGGVDPVHAAIVGARLLAAASSLLGLAQPGECVGTRPSLG